MKKEIINLAKTNSCDLNFSVFKTIEYEKGHQEPGKVIDGLHSN